MKRSLSIIPLLLLLVLLSSWGSRGHRIISSGSAHAYPLPLGFLKPNWTTIVTDYASEADYRKDTDPTEASRHYIDIDVYAEFLQTGKISQSIDSNFILHGYSFVLGHGILPWATLTTFDSLKACFQRHDWQRSALLAADLGHYVGDGHMPLHITENFNGQLTGQDGIHSHYETSMVGRYDNLLVYQPDTAHLISNVRDYIFSYIYLNHCYVDSILAVDAAARAAVGNDYSSAYYQLLWTGTGAFTIDLMKRGSEALANLIYTAWVQAGSPVFYPLGIGESASSAAMSLKIYPNPVISQATFQYQVASSTTPIILQVWDAAGRLCETLVDRVQDPGTYTLQWNSTRLSSGHYYCILRQGAETHSGQFIVQ